jgi:hexosaminidase
MSVSRSRAHLSIASTIAITLLACRPSATPTPSGPSSAPSIIPLPMALSRGNGSWMPADSVVVTLSNPADAELRELGSLAAELTRLAYGRPANLGSAASPSPRGIHLRISPDATASPESYHLKVASAGVEITAPAGAGLFYGLQTLRQLLDAASPAGVASVDITDAPRFSYRGLHLDVGRHFSSPEFVKRYIDLMARYKLNTFHWHLTEDQGWRIEIRKYPRLTEIGGCRRETMVEKRFSPYVGDGIRYCGFYTQDQIRDVVEYARTRYVTIIPEIEMPGHAKAALAAYPELACTPGPFEVRTTWGVDDDVFCPSEPTFAFIDDVLSEVVALFPGRYVHIGGDETPKRRWRASALAQEVMRREGLKDENELQSYFIRRVERMLIAKGRRLIGWDEILEGGLAPEATVMSWRGSSGGIAAAREGHDVIMTPNSHLYLDAYQGPPAFEPLAIGGFIPLERVYAFEPIPDSLTADQSRHILGAQGNVWTEYLKTSQAIEFSAYPRALALAEVVWSPRASRSWESFAARLPVALRALDKLEVNYRLPSVDGLGSDRLTLEDQATIRLRSLLPDAEIRYTTDGADPTRASELYRGPFTVPATAAGVRITARAFAADGRVSAPSSATITRTTYRAADPVSPGETSPGLTYSYYEAAMRSVRAIDTLRPVREAIASAVALRGDERPERYAIRFNGYISAPKDGMYEFALVSDDGSSLQVGDRVVIDHDGPHGADEKTGMIALRRGLHPFTVRFFQATGGLALSLHYRVGEGPWLPIPGEWLAHRR